MKHRYFSASWAVLTLPLLILFSSPVLADDLPVPMAQATVQPAKATLGDLVTLSVSVTHPLALTIEPPVLPKTLGTFEVYASTTLPAQPSGDQLTERFLVQLQNFTTGQQVLPGLTITYDDAMGKSHELKTNDLSVEISEVPLGPKDKGDIREIKGIIGPVAWSPWWWAILGVIALVGALYAWARRKKITFGPPPPPPIPADIVALNKLRELEEGDWVATGRLKEFYIALSDIVRGYLESGFQVPALERTSNELLRDIRKHTVFTRDQIAALKELLESCDLVKFAKFRPDAGEALKDHALATRFVENTRTALSVESLPPEERKPT